MMVNQNVNHPFNLVAWQFEILLDVPQSFGSEESFLASVDIFFLDDGLYESQVEALVLNHHLGFFEVSQALEFEAGSLSGDLEALLGVQGLFVDDVHDLLSVACFLVVG